VGTGLSRRATAFFRLARNSGKVKAVIPGPTQAMCQRANYAGGMTKRPHKPVTMSPWQVEWSEDIDEAIWRSHPEAKAGLARDTALLILGRSTDTAMPEDITSRVKHFIEQGGLDDVAHVWADAHALSLAGALWRLYRVRDQIIKQSEDIARLVAIGHDALNTIDPVVAGLTDPITAEGVLALIDSVFFGAFDGELAEALTRVGALAKLVAQGLLDVPHDQVESFDLARSSLAWGVIADELMAAGAQERRQGLS
jgi:hypothetical protein